MSLIPGRKLSVEDPARIAALVRACGLSDADVARIQAAQRVEELRFTEAAMRLGLVTQADVDTAFGPQAPTSPPTARPSPELVIAHDPFAPRAERLRGLRTEILLRHASEEPLALAVTGAERGEGRSRLAAELAIVLSQMARPTLLVDADLRAPRQHALFGADAARGLSDALGGGAAPAVHAVVGLPQLSLLCSGLRPANPVELLSGPAFSALMAGWKRRYRYVVLDTPPLVQCSDALAVAAAAGAVVTVLRRHHTPVDAGRDVVRRLAATQARLLGGVINDFGGTSSGWVAVLRGFAGKVSGKKSGK